jgi:transketolase
MALAEKMLAAEFNQDGHKIVNHHTYVFLGDGCLMEGISHEAVALAGAWKLNKLIALYDDNGISIDGQVAPWFIDNTPQRFTACGWNVIDAVDGHDAAAVSKAIAAAKHSADKPTLIVCKTAIGKGAPNRAGTSKAHPRSPGLDGRAFQDPPSGLCRLGRQSGWQGPRSRVEHRLCRLQSRFPRPSQRVCAPHEGRIAQELQPSGV